MTDYIPPRPGSLDAWLANYARQFVPSVIGGGLSIARAASIVSWECRYQPMLHIVNSSVPRFSQEMRDLEACEADESQCPEDDWQAEYDATEEPAKKIDTDFVEQSPEPIKPKETTPPIRETGADLRWIDTGRREIWRAILSDGEKGRLKGNLPGYEHLFELNASNGTESAAPCETKVSGVVQDTLDRFGPNPTNPHPPGSLEFKLTELANGLLDGTMTYGTPDFPGLQRLLMYECRHQIDQGNH